MTPATAQDPVARLSPSSLLALPAAPAEAAAHAFLLALRDPCAGTADLERRARAAYDAIGLYWEAAARLNERSPQ